MPEITVDTTGSGWRQIVSTLGQLCERQQAEAGVFAQIRVTRHLAGEAALLVRHLGLDDNVQLVVAERRRKFAFRLFT